MLTRRATLRTMWRPTIACCALSATLVARQSTPAPPPAPPAYASAWSVPVEESRNIHLAVGQHAVFVADADRVTAFARADGKTLWRYALEGVSALATSDTADAPVVALTSTHLVALTPDGGTERWKAAVPDPGAPCYLAASAIKGTGTSSAGIVFPLANGKVARAFRADGTVAWSADLPAAATTVVVPRDEHTAWVGTDGPALLELETPSGAIKSQLPLDAPAKALVVSPGRDDRAPAEMLVVASKPVLARYRIGDRDPSWDWPTGKGLSTPTGAPLVWDKVVYVTALDNTLQEIDRDSGSIRWRTTLQSRPASGPLTAGGLLLVPLASGDVFRLDPAYRSAIPFADRTGITDGRLQAFAIASDGSVFIVTFSTKTNALTAWRPAAPAKSPQHPPRPRPGA